MTTTNITNEGPEIVIDMRFASIAAGRPRWQGLKKAMIIAITVLFGPAFPAGAEQEAAEAGIDRETAAVLARLVAPPPPGSFAVTETNEPAAAEILAAAARSALAEDVLPMLSTEGDDTLDAALALYDLPRLGGSDCVSRLDRYLALVFVQFDVNSTVPSVRDDILLERIGADIAACPSAQVMVAGHADGSGSDAANAELSLRRAQAVSDRLAAFGVMPEAMQVVALGASAPLSQGATEETAADRRVDFRVLHRP